jgi:nanoRNase/pAp phosphatase (c-di-AMP/oligoRNAs hydrolase)
VDCLELELVPIEQVDWSPFWAVIIVDSQPGTGRHTIPEGLPIYGVIDHHETGGQLRGVPLWISVRMSELLAQLWPVTE